MFPNKLQYAKLQNFLPIGLNHSGPSGDAKTILLNSGFEPGTPGLGLQHPNY